MLYHTLKRFVFVFYKRKWTKIKKSSENKPRLFWGPEALLNFSIWSNIMNDSFESKSVVFKNYQINKEDDFDFVFSKMEFKYFKGNNAISRYLNFVMKEHLMFDFVINNFDVFFISYSGLNILGDKKWAEEIEILKKTGAKIVILPYGADWIRFSIYNGFSFKHGYFTHYPNERKQEDKIDERVKLLNVKSDVIVAGGMLWGKVWDVLSCNYISIDISKFNKVRKYDHADVVNIVHSPNHRYLKGTEFVLEAVQSLKNEGYNIQLVLLEKVKNDEVIRILNEDADILIEQLLNGYSLSGIEGMAAGLPVLSNLEDEEMSRKVFRRFSYLDECPILSTTPETIKEHLRVLIENSSLRKELGEASRKYVEKYHSTEGSRYMFDKIIDRVWYGKEVDLMNMYHPLHPDSYNNKSPKIVHPLIENKIPNKLLEKLNR